ncbi:serine hydrolase [Luteimonas sp. SJ-92]|uniref:beta-lactamase n=2 Tax=Luteimonas salinisoli TaxID=2752307 RepID=A0A853JA57_9GAMM|nr:serine hydrolase [Luteimonas salinisoli]
MLLGALLATALLAGCRTEEVPERGAIDAPPGAPEPVWAAPLETAVREIDGDMPGDFGVYVRRLGEDAGTLDRAGDRRWYLSSTVKVPVAIAVLERVDAGELSLDRELVLAESDFVDGAGDMLAQEPGTGFSIAALLEKSLRDSDSTATDMLIRLLGEDALNRRIAEWSGGGFGPITTILQVRYDAYGALHPGVADLPNTALLRLRNAEAGEPRLAALARELGVPRAALDADDLESVFGAYYETGRNAATLEGFATVLEKLVTGRLLSPASTGLLLDHMRAISTGGARIQAGLPAGVDFAQKTGTQLARACNVGVLDPGRGAEGATLVLACAEDFDDLGQAERAFRALGGALAEVALAAPAG